MITLAPMKPRRARKYDCGQYGLLTVAEIAKRTGRTKCTIRNRIKRGVLGESLATNPPPRARTQSFMDGQPVGLSARAQIFVACRIAQRTRKAEDITIKKLMDEFHMSRATAYRWRRAWLDAAGIFE